MTETAVHVETIEQWKSVLDVWFKQGYSWYSGDKTHMKNYFKDGGRELLLDKDNDILIPTSGKREPITYSEFMAQQKEDNKMETYYVTKEQYDLIEELKCYTYPLNTLVKRFDKYSFITDGLSNQDEKALLRYIGGDETIEFKVKEQLYRLWRIDDEGDKVYMIFNSFGTPDSDLDTKNAFTATEEEIKKWKTPAWEIEEVK